MLRIKLYELLVKAIIVLTMVQYGFYVYVHHSSVFNLVDDILVILLFLLVLFEGNPKIVEKKRTAYDLPIFVLFLLTLISAFVNQTPLQNFVLSVKSYYIYIPLLYSIIWIKFDKDQMRSILQTMILIFLLQLPVMGYQYFYSQAHHTLNEDSLFGTFNSSNFMGYALLAILYYTCYRYYFNHEKKFGYVTAILIVILILTSSRYAIIAFPLLFLGLNPIKLIKNTGPGKIAILVLLLILVPFLVDNSFLLRDSTLSEYYTVSGLETQFLVRENKVSSGSGRNLWYPLTLYQLNEYSTTPWLGFGPGMYASYTAMRLMPAPNNRIYNYFEQKEIGLDPEVDSQIIPIWGELGYLGLAAMFTLLGVIGYRLYSMQKMMKDSISRAIAGAALAYAIFFIAGFYVRHMLESQTTALVFFLFVGFTERLSKIDKSDKERSK